MTIVAILLCLFGFVTLVAMAGLSLHWNLVVKPRQVQQAFESLEGMRFPAKVEFPGLTTYWDFINRLACDESLPSELRERARCEVERVVQMEAFLGPWARVRYHSTLNAALRRIESIQHAVPDGVALPIRQSVRLGR
jgi:hypothetical protein